MKKTLLLLLIIFLVSQNSNAQFSLSGTVWFNYEKQGGALVTLSETGDSLYTSATGSFHFTDLPSGDYTVRAAFDDVTSSEVKISVQKDVYGIHIDIIDIWQINLDAVYINAVNLKDDKALHSIRTGVVSLSDNVLTTTSVEQLMNRAAGIRVRNSGGLGAAADVVVGGFSGKSVKFLIDDIPIDYLGSSMNITGLSSSMAERIEIYKGVLPTEIGIDALGGAINIVSKKQQQDRHVFSFETGSFNTNRLSLNLFIRHSDKLSFGANIYADYSANNFKVDNLPYADEETGRTEYITAKLFHNGYRQMSGDVYLNIENRKWADLFKIRINSYELKKDIQNDFASRARPFGGVYRKEYAYAIPSVQHKKSFKNECFEVSQFLVFSSIKNELSDTVRDVRYDWLGVKHPAASGSEMGTDMSNLKTPVIETLTNNVTYRALLTYNIKRNKKLILNIVNNYLLRTSDDLSRYDTKEKVRYNRLITGLGYQYRFLNNSIEGLTQIKYLSSQTGGEVFDEQTQSVMQIRNNSGWSFAQSLKYQSLNGWLIRMSAENTFRLPDQMEVFGDNVFIIPNLSLKPERSINVNLGARYRSKNRHSIELNTYWRDVKEMVRLKELSQFVATFLNLDKVRGYGVELEGTTHFFRNWEASGNLTYNGFRFRGSDDTGVSSEHFINARVSNMPFYFGNAQIAYQFNPFFTGKDQLRLYWTYTYVHQFYLDFIEKQFEPDGFLGLFGKSKIYTNRIIPTQQVHAAGFIWSHNTQKNKIISLSGEINNMFDKPIYNNFKMQSAGRSISLKITYEL